MNNSIEAKRLAHAIKGDKRIICPHCGSILDDIIYQGHSTCKVLGRFHFRRDGFYHKGCDDEHFIMSYDFDKFICPNCLEPLDDDKISKRLVD